MQDSAEISDLLQDGLENLEIIKRQVVIGNLFKTSDLVVERHFQPK